MTRRRLAGFRRRLAFPDRLSRPLTDECPELGKPFSCRRINFAFDLRPVEEHAFRRFEVHAELDRHVLSFR